MRKIVGRYELIAAMSFFSALGLLLAATAGGPLHSDEVWYMHLGLNGVQDAHWLNRYFHVYAQALFMRLAPTPLQGAGIFWAFLISLSAATVYLCARILRPSNHFVHGLTATALFLSFPLLREFSGDPVVDITGMAVVMIFVLLYLLSFHGRHVSAWPVISMGIVLVLAFKTKENNVLVALLVLGLGHSQGRSFSIRTLLINLKRLSSGLLLGLLLFIVWDALILGDALFSLRPANWKLTTDFYLTNAPTITKFGNWYSEAVLPLFWAPSLLYVISGVSRSSWKLSPALRLLWLVPLLLLTFLVLSTIRSQFEVIPRYAFPLVPLVSVLAAQFLEFELPEKAGGWLRPGAISALGLVGLALLWSISYGHAVEITVRYEHILTNIIYPVLTAILLAAVFLIRHQTLTKMVLPMVCLTGLLAAPLAANFNSIVRTQPVKGAFERKYHPFVAYAGELRYWDGMRLCLSTDLAEQEAMLSNKVDEVLSMFNVSLGVNASRDNFHFLSTPEQFAAAIRDQGCDYLFLSTQNWSDSEGLQAAAHPGWECRPTEDQDLPLVFVDCTPE